jgi:hypothetical protein
MGQPELCSARWLLVSIAGLAIFVGPAFPQTNRERVKVANEKKKAEAEQNKKAAEGLKADQSERPDEKAGEPASVAVPPPRLAPAVGIENVKGVMRLDTRSRQNDFDLLTGEEQKALLSIAANVAGLANTPVVERSMRHLALSHLLDPEKARKWLAGQGDADGARDFTGLLGIPATDRERIAARFALMNQLEQGEARRLAQSIKQNGLGGLADYEKKRVRSDKELYAIE